MSSIKFSLFALFNILMESTITPQIYASYPVENKYIRQLYISFLEITLINLAFIRLEMGSNSDSLPKVKY